ncbi:hypothetical protein SUNI508_12849 [Seiridium unicorne]|uniref:ubiquitinyl hydrolase 1 n=1 Tax=Seiridium unicorne TaxID=138068 RepID=A0ABR2VGG4_9PEZI
MTSLSKPSLMEAVFNHLCLPRRVPGSRDPDPLPLQIQNDLITRMSRACGVLKDLTSSKAVEASSASLDLAETWDAVHDSLKICGKLNQGYLEKSHLQNAFQGLQPGITLILNVVHQNAAVLIRRHCGEETEIVVFECFELSPTPDEVLAAQNALDWEFPGRAVEIPIEIFQDNSFQASLAQMLEQASSEKLQSCVARTTKAGVPVIESRGTTDPALITQMLLPMLEAVGSYHDTVKLRKRIRDDVNINNAELPWRRLPAWLLLRVATQRQLQIRLGCEDGRACYKILISTVLAQFLEDCTGTISSELSLKARDKLATRLAKLEQDVDSLQSTSSMLRELLSTTTSFFEKVLDEAGSEITRVCEHYRRNFVRSIESLPPRASLSDLQMKLPNSGKFLTHLLETSPPQQTAYLSITLPKLESTMKQSVRFMKEYVELSEFEASVKKPVELFPAAGSVTDNCAKIADSCGRLIDRIGSAYISNPAQMSKYLLIVFELWIRMDEEAIKGCSILTAFHPIFAPELLDVLQFSSREELQRIRRVQEYLQRRVNQCRGTQRSILSSVEPDCFAWRFFQHSQDLHRLMVRLEEDSESARNRKEVEWESMCLEYDDLTQKILERTCECIFDNHGRKIKPVCRKCSCWGARYNLKITIHEDYLPEDRAQRYAMLFELAMPKFLRDYRDATWNICSTLTLPNKSQSKKDPEKLMEKYGDIMRKEYVNWVSGRITLASDTKAFHDTHYQWQNVKVDLSSVILPNPLNLAYWDKVEKQWVSQFDSPLTLQHLCGVHVPECLNTILPRNLHPDVNLVGPSSYEVMANQAFCPRHVLPQEYMSLQQLISSNTVRWPLILRELESSNLDFKNEETVFMISQLATQAGAANQCESSLGDLHFVFQDPCFCSQLATVIKGRLDSIELRYYEAPYMDLLLTLCINLADLPLNDDQNLATPIMKRIRVITLQWIQTIRTELQDCSDCKAAESKAQYGLWAALICRRTFLVHLTLTSKIKAAELYEFIKASLALQWNLVIDPTKLPTSLRNALVRDAQTAASLTPIIRESIGSDSSGLEDAINAIWSSLRRVHERTYSAWEAAKSPPEDEQGDTNWIFSVATNRVGGHTYRQVIHYNFIEGYLLVDGKPLGKLPENVRESVDVKKIFGTKYLLTCPSNLQGMSHMLVNNERGHQIHFGVRDDVVVIRDLTKDGILEFIPRWHFASDNSFDFPSSLVDNCVHWLNLKTKRLEIRREPGIWVTRPDDWVLDMNIRQAKRKTTYLVSPHCALANRIGRNFAGFESPYRLTICQPSQNRLAVELRHLELSFAVNGRGCLQSLEQNMEIDPNQDAGTLYGCQSMLVLRDVRNLRKRSIIMATGALESSRADMHIRWGRNGGSEYFKFEIDQVLGRLVCAPEPWLLYSKAQAHALTSFVLPDPLTGRTGAEEAIAILTSSQSHPWAPLTQASQTVLREISAISPSRVYYPEDKRCLQKVGWHDNLTTTIQSDCYESVVAAILEKSSHLSGFFEVSATLQPPEPSNLRIRGQTQQLKYERMSSAEKVCQIGTDKVYHSRDRHANSSRALNVFQTADLLARDDFRLRIDHDLMSIMTSWGKIGGFTSTDREVRLPLSELVEKHVSENWGTLVNLCRRVDPEREIYNLMFQLCLLAFGNRQGDEMEVISILAAFGCLEDLKGLPLPTGASFTGFVAHEIPDEIAFQELISVGYRDYEEMEGLTRGQQAANRRAHQMKMHAEGVMLASLLARQWPKKKLTMDGFEPSLVDMDQAFEVVAAEWERLHRNKRLSEFLHEVQSIVSHCTTDVDCVEPKPSSDKSTVYFWQRGVSERPCLEWYLTQDFGSKIPLALDINEKFKPKLHEDPWPPLKGPKKLPASDSSGKEITELEKILDNYSRSNRENASRKQYSADLKRSLEAFKRKAQANPPIQESTFHPSVDDFIRETNTLLNTSLGIIQKAIHGFDTRSKWLQKSRLWPCIGPITILEHLQATKRHALGRGWIDSIVKYGVGITVLQRGMRLRDAQIQSNSLRIKEELENIGHQNWNPADFPDWLLLEIDSDLRIRDEQVEVASTIISPPSDLNTVLQLNMGRGKTSCILPMAAAVLANGSQLSRLVVPKPLLMQTAQILQTKLGGLLGRDIIHIPFSRRTPTTQYMMTTYQNLHKQAMMSRGILLTVPETILSFKLSGLQRLKDLRIDEARELIDFQDWLTEKCRDIIDESDFTLAVRTQLIYPSGTQESLDGHALRWKVSQGLLALLEMHLAPLQKEFPDGIIIVKRVQGFPSVHFLKEKVEDALTTRLIHDVANGKLQYLRLSTPVHEKISSEIIRVLSGEDLIRKHFRRAARHFADRESAYKSLLLVRGLLRHKVLLSCLKKRWNVQFGLHPNRDPIAVPYEAKGVPHEQSEFGHPDASIAFTCLSFYYGGVTMPQFREAVQRLLGSDDPATEYDRWTGDCRNLAWPLRQWNAVNLEDGPQIQILWKALRFQRNMVDNYLNNFVFPVHAKQFSVKLQASGWDLPQFSAGGKRKANITVGFSGTNDNKSLLPLTIHQYDLPALKHTNALVLTYLLKSRSRDYIKAMDASGRPLSEAGLLHNLHSKHIRLLIDAGAYILDMDNETLAKRWLEIDPDAKAAVFFKNDNRAWVKYRGQRKPDTPLLATPFVDRLEQCVVYLDQAHTRGTDFKFPPHIRGALTLALNQTKDHTVQDFIVAAMRLRQLETTQAVTFFAPLEVHQNIVDVCGKKPSEKVDSADVVFWLLEQTCRANDALRNLFIAQGHDFCQRSDAAFKNGNLLSNKSQRDAYIKVVEQSEKQTLEQSYGEFHTRPKTGTGNETRPKYSSQRLQSIGKGLEELEKFSRDAPVGNLDVLGEVEQEREVEYLVEEVRQVKKPPKRSALEFPKLHKYLEHFLELGCLPLNHKFKHAMTALARTAVGKKYEITQRGSNIFVSEEFLRTVYLHTHEVERNDGDEYMRPVEWILWSRSSETAVIIIPEEAELLIHRLNSQTGPQVHLLTYASPVSKQMVKLGQLGYCNIPALPMDYEFPSWLLVELGIFAGRLYLDYNEYVACKRLVEDGEVSPNTEVNAALASRDARGLLLEWLTFRHRGQDVQHTPMGFLCLGRHVGQDHPFFGTSTPIERDLAPVHDSRQVALESDVTSDDTEEFDDESDWELMEEDEPKEDLGFGSPSHDE